MRDPGLQDASPTLLPHEALLCACARSHVDAGSRRAVDAALAAPDMAWPAAVAASVRQGVAQHLALHLRAFANDPRVPGPILACCERMLRANALRNAVFFHQTGRVLRALRADGVRCLILKGVALALTVYPDPALRNFADIDLLVDDENLDAAEEAALACGFGRAEAESDRRSHHRIYHWEGPEDILTATVAPEFDAQMSRELLERYRHRVVLEIHRGLFRDAASFHREVDSAAIWRSPQPGVLPDGTPFCQPAPEMMLVHLCHHAAVHHFARLLYPLDITAVVRTYGARLDWNRVRALARHYAVRGDLYRGLELAQRALCAEVPAHVVSSLAAELGRRRANEVVALPDVLGRGQEPATERIWRRWLRTQSPVERAVALRRLLFPSPAAARRAYGVQSPLQMATFYLLRPFHLTGSVLRFLWRARRPRR